jgi:hypothetical protein
LLVPFAACAGPGCAEALGALRLPHLRRLLARMGAPVTDAGPADSLSAPHERVLARALGVEPVDGLVPLAALQLAQEGGTPGDAAWAWITPCHLRVGTDHVRMAHPRELQLDGDDSRALLAAMAPYFGGDGITLEYQGPLRWLASGEIFRSLPAASLDRVAGRVIDAWMPRGDAGRPLRRLQQEMQMLLYTLPLNEARQRGGLLPVNSFWVSGSGALPPGYPARPPAAPQVRNDLRDAALLQDGPAWIEAWQQLDAREGPRLLAALEQGRAVRITLAGESGARTWDSQGTGAWRKLLSHLTQPALAALLESL